MRACQRFLSRSAQLIGQGRGLQDAVALAAPQLIAAAWVSATPVVSASVATSQALWHHGGNLTWQHPYSSQAAGSGSGSSGSSPDVVDQLDQMMEVMMSNPALQQMIMARMPPHMRKPEVIKAMMANPEVRQRIAALAQQSGLGQMLSQLDASKMQSSLSATSQAGLNPTELFERFQQSPTLGPRMSDPRVLTALMDMASNGPEALKKYEGDKDVIEAAMEAGDIIQQMQQERQQQGGVSSSSSSDGTSAPPTSIAGIEAQLGVNPQELMQRLMSQPELLAKVQNPKVQQALQEIAQSPWKIAKYLFNKEVMSTIKDMKDLLQKPTGK